MDISRVVHHSNIIDLGPDFDLLQNPPVQFSFFIGVDIGKAQDSTVITTIQRKDVNFKKVKYTEYSVLDIVKLPKKVDFVKQAQQIADYLRKTNFKNHSYECCVDASGVGAPVCDFIKSEHPDVKIRPIHIVSGEGKKYNRYSRNYLINMVRNWMGKSNFKISSDLEEADELKRQIETIEEIETQAGNILLKTQTQHDDHLMSLALALIELNIKDRIRGGTTDYLFSHL